MLRLLFLLGLLLGATPAHTQPVTVSSANCVSGPDCAPAFQAAFNAVASAGGGEIIVPPYSGGCWPLLTRAALTTSFVHFHDQGLPCITGPGGIDAYGCVGGACSINFTGATQVGTASQPRFGAMSVQVPNNGAGFSAGQYIWLNGKMPGNVNVMSLVTRITQVDQVGNLYLDHPIPTEMQIGGASTALQVAIVQPLEGLRIHGLRFVGTGTTSLVDALSMSAIVKSDVYDLTFENYNGSCPKAQVTLDLKIHDIRSEHCGGVLNSAAQSAAFAMNFGTALQAARITTIRPQGAGQEYYQVSYGNLSDLASSHAEIWSGTIWSGRNIKLSGTLLSTFTNITATGAYSTNLAVADGSQGNAFTNVMLAVAGNNAGDGNGLWMNNANNNGNTFFGLSTYNNQHLDIQYGASDTGNRVYGVGWSGQWQQGSTSNTIQ